MSQAASPLVKAGLILAAILIACAKVRTNSDLPSCSQEVTRCLAACRAVCARRLTDAERAAKLPTRVADDRVAA